MRGHSGETFHSRAGPLGGTRHERDRGCCPGQAPSPTPVFPGPSASAASEPARTGRLVAADLPHLFNAMTVCSSSAKAFPSNLS
ncbi:unnamed protein product [Coccothraustes coccothraustes]